MKKRTLLYPAHLATNLALYRLVTEPARGTTWCIKCQLHDADTTGLCPLCQDGR